ncbi:histidine kinase [Paenibacillus sp. P96]|uniref:Histidine kinase n=1 Tax=Paenibacillus zeirhizosphaerae TaxID=2987519 RepID=A0ABT9FR02_9BACL|nr:histidine kinase [Paenibacillus sp. P96]MDP4097162.1 histidine kinase [Paenibacillus sp. P96]
MFKFNFYTKIVTLAVIMMIPIMLLYFYSNKITTDVLSEELGASNINQLVFFQSQVNTNIELLSSWPNLLIHDPDILSFQDIFLEDQYLDLDAINLVKRIQTKLSIQESSSNWDSSISIYSPSLGRVVTERDAQRYETSGLREEVKPGWKVERQEQDGNERFVFSWHTVSPFSAVQHPETANTIIKVEFDSGSIQDMLDRFKSDGRGDPFYFRKDMGVIYNRTANQELIGRLLRGLGDGELKNGENRTLEVNGNKYMVSMVLSEATGWYLIDYTPLSAIMEPIDQSNRLFYVSAGGLLLFSFLAAYMLYSQVQVPIGRLVAGFRRLAAGDYSVRMQRKGSHEFSFLADRFNQMVEQIQQLFEKVYMEKIHVREARLKQLQSQINPHFFYNCFSFMTSMAKLKKHEAVIAMSHHLSRYYRYTTRQERELVPLDEEIEFVTHYLEIQNMRMPRLSYSIELSPQMGRLSVPPLIIQPLVENAVIHGIEQNADNGLIHVTAEFEQSCMKIHVDDNGKGMSEMDIFTLEQKLRSPMDEKMGCGVWNVYQRMRLRFGENAGLAFARSPYGGLRATLYWTEPDSINVLGEHRSDQYIAG